MALFLVDPVLEMSIQLTISEPIEQALAIQWQRMEQGNNRDNFCRRIALHLDAIIPEAIDWDIKSPTPAQMSFALVISKHLGIPLPADAVRYRGQMHAFIEQYAPVMKERQTKAYIQHGPET